MSSQKRPPNQDISLLGLVKKKIKTEENLSSYSSEEEEGSPHSSNSHDNKTHQS